MAKNQNKTDISDIPSKIFGRLFDELKDKSVPEDIIDRLRSTVSKESQPSDKEIKDAIFPDET